MDSSKPVPPNELSRLHMRFESDYLSLEGGRGTHTKDVKTLCEAIGALYRNPALEENRKTADIIKLLENAYEKSLLNFTTPKFNLFAKPKNADDFTDNLNKNMDDHHYARMIALILQRAYLENPNLKCGAIGDVFRVKTPDERIYNFMFPLNEGIKSSEQCKNIKLHSKGVLTDRDVDNMSLGQLVFDVQVAKKCWPHLQREYRLKDDEIKLLLKDGVTDKLVDACQTGNFMDSVLAEATPGYEAKQAAQQQKQQIRAELQQVVDKVKEIETTQKVLIEQRRAMFGAQQPAATPQWKMGKPG